MQASEAAELLGAELRGSDAWFQGCSIDSRSITAGQMFIALPGSHVDGHDYVGSAAQAGASVALAQRNLTDIDIPVVVAADSRRAMGTLGGHWRRRFELPLIALTGSNGKTTVKEMLTAILSRQAPVLATRGNLNNDIGVPMTLYGLGDEHRYAVIEMGANHAGEIEYLSRMAAPAVALITQCAPAHLEGFGSIDGVAQAKGEIFRGLGSDGVAIINADDNYADYWRGEAATYHQLSFGLGAAADVTARDLRVDDNGQRFTLCLDEGSAEVRLALPGRHNVMNALAAAACCRAVGLSLDAIRAGLEAASSIGGRLQFKQAPSGAHLLDDSYNANPASLEAALEVLGSLPGRHWLVLGDMGELGRDAVRLHEEAGAMARASGVERLWTVGELSRNAVRGFGAGARHYPDDDSLLEDLRADLGEGYVVLIKGSRAAGMERIVTGLLEEN